MNVELAYLVCTYARRKSYFLNKLSNYNGSAGMLLFVCLFIIFANVKIKKINDFLTVHHYTELLLLLTSGHVAAC